jgi:hypothetical protein
MSSGQFTTIKAIAMMLAKRQYRRFEELIIFRILNECHANTRSKMMATGQKKYFNREEKDLVFV